MGFSAPPVRLGETSSSRGGKETPLDREVQVEGPLDRWCCVVSYPLGFAVIIISHSHQWTHAPFSRRLIVHILPVLQSSALREYIHAFALLSVTA